MTDAEREFVALIIGHRVRQVRRGRRMSQETLAQGVGSQSMISLIEGGHQLPLPDVIWTIARRLDDPILLDYAKGLEENTLNQFSASSHNADDLLSILVNHRGRWHPPHERIASQLCRHYYATLSIERVQELCRLVIHHVSHNPLLAEAYFYLGSSYLQINQFQEAEYWLKLSEKLFDHLTDEMRGRLSYNLGYAYTYLDIQVLALWYTSRAVDIFNRCHDFFNQGKAMGLLGTIQTHLGRLEEAKHTLSISLDILRRWDTTPLNEARILTTLAEVCWLLGETDESSRYASTAQEIVPEDDFLCRADIYRLKSYLALKIGQTAQAWEFYEIGLSAARTAGDPHSLGQMYLLCVQLSSDSGERLESAKEAFLVTENTNHHILHAVAAETAIQLMNSESQKEKVTYYMQSALDSYRTYVHKNSMYTHLIDNLAIHSKVVHNGVQINEIKDDTVAEMQQHYQVES